MTQSVGIIGHGLTGITAAIMLARAGYQVDLIGPRPEFSGGLQLAPNGLAALQSLGHYEAVREKAVRLESIRITAMGDGRSLADISHNDKRVYLGVGRADLYQLLAKHLSQQKNIRTLASPAVHLASSGEKMEI
ncbi:MAG: FAD-dependent monooxygenase, partial [Alphaproteobacteria bacterium]